MFLITRHFTWLYMKQSNFLWQKKEKIVQICTDRWRCRSQIGNGNCKRGKCATIQRKVGQYFSWCNRVSVPNFELCRYTFRCLRILFFHDNYFFPLFFLCLWRLRHPNYTHIDRNQILLRESFLVKLTTCIKTN